ncbi:MAG: ABC transporter substrate-binding protein, partial [Clostridiaceae bacterium]
SDDVLKFGEINGVLNAIAVSVTGRSAFYNKTTYDALGVAIPKTWDELIAAGKAFEAKDPSKYAFDLDTGSGFTGLYMALAYEAQKTGKEFITADGKLGFSEAEILDAFNFYLSLEKNHVIRTQKDRMNDSGEDALYQTEKFINGSVAGVLEWSSSIGKFEKVLTENPTPQELVLGELLVMDGAKNSGWMQKPSLLFAINGKTEHPVESAIFLDWLLNDAESSKLLGSSRGIPSSKSALAALEGTPALKGLAFNATKQIADSKPLLISPYLENSSLKEVYKVAIEDISYGSKTPEDAAKYFVEQVTKILTEIVK